MNESTPDLSFVYDRGMPLIHCPKCGQAYDVPGLIAVRLSSAIATCHCGEWLAGSKAAVLARMHNPETMQEVDLQPYRIDGSTVTAPSPPDESPFDEISLPRSVRVSSRHGEQSVNAVFTIHEHALWVGRKGCHVEIDDAGLSLRHFAISVRGSQLILRDAASHMGTFVDGMQIDEIVIEEGVHIVRAGSALISIEPTAEEGRPVELIRTTTEITFDESAVIRKLQKREQEPKAATRPVLVCIDGPLNGQEFEIPQGGLVVGREGHVRVPDEFLSRRHFEVLPGADGEMHVRDLGSRNGTFLNTLPARNTKVHSGDEIRAGTNRFRIEHRQ